MMLNLKTTKQFKKDIKKYKHKNDELIELNIVIDTLLEGKVLDEKYSDHPLTGNWKGFRDCHIKPDLLLIYRVHEKDLVLERLGSHSELFSHQ